MARILIPSKPDDADAIYVKLALEEKGHECIVWYTADFPGRQRHSFEVFDNRIFWHAGGVDLDISDQHQFDVVWLRRPRKPQLPNIIHRDDLANAMDENMALFRSFWRVIAPEAFWANPIDRINAANCKLLQLKMAMEAGFTVPATLVSNDPKKIREFINQYKNQDVIYKTLHPVIWMGRKTFRLTYTDEITIEDLPSDEMLQATPGIFQHRIKKKFELRVTYFGSHAITVKIRSQEHQMGIMDWRYIPTSDLKIEPFQLPQKIDAQCRIFMKKLGLVMGCFDFIVTPEGEYHFLEINEQGQFLWIEELNPEIKILDAFSDFLIDASSNFIWKKKEKCISLSDYKKEMISIKMSAMMKHVKSDDLERKRP